MDRLWLAFGFCKKAANFSFLVRLNEAMHIAIYMVNYITIIMAERGTVEVGGTFQLAADSRAQLASSFASLAFGVIGLRRQYASLSFVVRGRGRSFLIADCGLIKA